MKHIDELSIYAMPGHLIRRMHQVSMGIFASEVARAGGDLTPVQYAALNAIKTYPGVDQATLASAIAYDRATIGGVINRLQEKGLVRRETTPANKRSRFLYIEPTGEVVLAQVEESVLRVQEKLLHGLEAHEKAQLIHLLSKALEATGDLSRAPLKLLQNSDFHGGK